MQKDTFDFIFVIEPPLYLLFKVSTARVLSFIYLAYIPTYDNSCLAGFLAAKENNPTIAL